MKDRNRLRTPLAPQGCGGPGTPGDFARSGYRYRARSVRSLRHPAHPVSAARHDLVSVHIYPTPTLHQQPHPKSAPAPTHPRRPDSSPEHSPRVFCRYWHTTRINRPINEKRQPGGGKTAPSPLRPLNPGYDIKPRRRGLNEGSRSLANSTGSAGLWQARYAR